MPRGRPSAEAEAVKITALPSVPGRVPDQPDDLDPAAANVWRSTVAALPSSWVKPEAYPVLMQFCRHTVIANALAQQITELLAMTRDPNAEKRLHTLMRLHAAQTSALNATAVKLRLTPSSRSSPDAARGTRKRASGDVVKPWNDWAGAREPTQVNLSERWSEEGEPRKPAPSATLVMPDAGPPKESKQCRAHAISA